MVAFKADNSVLAISMISQEQGQGKVLVDTPSFPSLGYINKTPDLVVLSGQYYISSASAENKHNIEIVLGPSDAAKLSALTSNHFGDQLAVLVHSEVVAAPRIYAQISDGRFVLALPDSSFLILSNALSKVAAVKH